MTGLRDVGVDVHCIDTDAMSLAVGAALRRGPVVVLVTSRSEAHFALESGAHEAMVSDGASLADVLDLVDKAALRATAGRLRDQHVVDRVRTDDSAALALMVASLGQRLAAPLRDALALQAEGATPPAGSAVQSALHDATNVLRLLEELSPSAARDEKTDATLALQRVAAIFSPTAQAVASFELMVPDEAVWIPMPAWQLTLSAFALLDNALDAIRTPNHAASVTMSLFVEDDTVVIEVCDDGRGMPPEERLRAAEPFYSNKIGGDGLGLSLVAARVRRCGGELTIDSDPELGTAVRLFFARMPAPVAVNSTDAN